MSKATKSKKSPGRGRPAVYVGAVVTHIVSLVKRHNATNARAILNAGPRNAIRALRNLELVPKALGISMPTILKFVHAKGVELPLGRPAKAA